MAGADLLRTGLTGEAIRLGRVLAALMPDEPEVRGLLALMLLHDARRAARLDDAGIVGSMGGPAASAGADWPLPAAWRGG